MSCSTSLRASPRPTMMPDLVNTVGSSSLARCSRRSECEVARARPDRQIERRHGLEIVVEDVGPRLDDDVKRAVLAQEVRRQHLDRGSGRGGADGADHRGEMRRAAVRQIVAIDRGDDDMLETQLGDGVGDPLRLVRVESAGQPGLDVAEGAGARAGVAHDHHGGVLLRPALADIGAAGLLADGDEAVLAHDLARSRDSRRTPAPSPGSSPACAARPCRADAPFPDA